MSSVFELDLKHMPKFVLLVLADHADDSGSNSWIAKKASLSESTVRRCLKFLLQKQYITVERKSAQHRPTTYRLAFRHPVRGLLESRGVTQTPLSKTPRGVRVTFRGSSWDTRTVLIEPS